jgi:polar amino acid transport system permease protein
MAMPVYMKKRQSGFSRYLDVAKFIFVLAACGYLVFRGSEQLGYNWHWQSIPSYLFTQSDGHLQIGPIMQGLVITLEITFFSLLLSALIGFTVALLRLSNSLIGRWLAMFYLETIRNTPLLVQIFFLYFVMAPILDIGRFATAVLALSFFEGAYASEIIRAGMVAVPVGQWEASHALGLSSFDTYRTVIIPQALRRIVPPLTSQAVSLLKDSALVSTIAVYDLTMEGRTIIAETFLTFEVWFTVAAIYLALALLMSFAADRAKNYFQAA